MTVKHRIGIDRSESYEFVRDFVGTVAAGRLRGLHRPRAQRLAEGPEPEGEPRGAAAALRDRATGSSATSRSSRSCSTAASTDEAQIAAQLQHVDGVMVGREAYHNPWLHGRMGRSASSARRAGPRPSARRSSAAMVDYMERVRRRRRAVVAGGAPHAGPVQRPAGRAPLAAGVVGPPAQAFATARVAAAGAAARQPALRPPRN